MEKRHNRNKIIQKPRRNDHSYVGLATAIMAVIALAHRAYCFFTHDQSPSENIDPEEKRLDNLILLGKDRQALMGLDLIKVDYPITFKVLKVPVKTKVCGHYFEEHEICDWVRRKDYCPECFSPLSRKDLVKVVKY